MDEVVIQKAISRINSEPAHQILLLKILKNCEEPIAFLDLQQRILAFPETQNSILPPETLIKWLEEDGAIQQTRSDDNFFWEITPEGQEILYQEAPNKKLLTLYEKEPQRKPLFEKLISYCKEGRSRLEIEDYLNSDPLLEEQGFLPTYLIQRLEGVGAIKWVNNKWKTHSEILGKNN